MILNFKYYTFCMNELCVIMKIGVDIRTLMDAQYSGVSEYTLNLLKEILKLDTVNEYRLFYNCFGDIRGQMLAKCGLTRNNVEIVGYGYPNKVLNYLLFKIFNYPKIDEKLETDVFFMPHINFIGLTQKSPPPPFVKGGARSVITIHDLSFLKYPEFFSARKNFWHKMVNVKKLVKRFDVVVAVSENTKRDVVELCGVNSEKVKVIYSGIGSEYRKLQITNYKLQTNSKFQIQNLNVDGRRLAEVKSKYSLPDKFILYLGTVEPRKNVDGIIRAYNQLRINNYELRNVKLVIAGDRGWKSEKIYREWEKSEFKDDIKFLGYVDSQDKVYLYNLAWLFAYPSFYEGFGLPPLEAMAFGLPVVASYAASLPEVTGEAALMVDPYNISDIARAMKEILIDESLKNKLVEQGLKNAKKFSWEKATREYLELFNEL